MNDVVLGHCVADCVVGIGDGTVNRAFAEFTQRWSKNSLGAGYTSQFVIGENGCYEGYRPASVSVDARRIDVKTGKLERGLVWSFSTDGSDGGVRSRLERSALPDRHAGLLRVSEYVQVLQPELRSIGRVDDSAVVDRQKTRKKERAGPASISIASAEPSNSEGWSVETLELQPTPIHPRDLAIDPADKPLLHVVLSCHCDAPSVDLLLPITRTGIEITDELQRAAGVKLTKNGPKGSSRAQLRTQRASTTERCWRIDC
jgi:hypothetical protein